MSISELRITSVGIFFCFPWINHCDIIPLKVLVCCSTRGKSELVKKAKQPNCVTQFSF